MQRTKISAAQFFVALFVSRSVVTIALSTRYTGTENMLECIFSYFLAMGVSVLIALPIWGAVRISPEHNVPELAMDRLGWMGGLVPVCYGLYFILTGGVSLGLFQIFLMDTVNPGFSAGLVTAAMLAVALYGALRGVETVARCAACVFVVLILGCGLVLCIVAGRFDPRHLEPVFYNGFSQTGQSLMLFLSRTSVFADMAVLLPQVKGRRKLGFAGWMAGSWAFVSVILLLISGCLGRYASTQNFPVYVLASLTEVRSLQRLDAIFTGVWMMGLIIKLALDLYACRVCFFSLTKARAKEPAWAVWITAGAMLVLALVTARSMGAQQVLLDTGLLFWCAVISGAALPLIVWVAGAVKRKGRRREK